MNLLYFIQHNYDFLLLPLVVLAIVHGIAFVVRRFFIAFLGDSLLPTAEPTKHFDQVTQLRNERMRLRAELEAVEAQLATYGTRSNLREQSA
jgi:hypothetical protein